jgi:uncharacterized protein (DUF2147 family)
MRHFMWALIGTASMLASAHAAEPAGEWLVANGSAQIRIDNCAGAYWGIIFWEKEPGRDRNNPEPSKRSRATLGIPILLNMQPDGPNRWAGRVYNAQNGKTYDASISLTGNDTLRIEGCLMRVFCGGETWTRVPPIQPSTATNRTNAAPKTGSAKQVDALNVCSRIPDGAGPSQ